MGMDSVKQIDFLLNGVIEGQPISPKTINLHLFNTFNHDVEEFIVGSGHDQAKDVHVSVEEGSYRFIAYVPFLLATIIEHDLQQLERQDSLGRIDAKRARVVSNWQTQAKKKGTFSIQISSNDLMSSPVIISGASDYHTQDENEWVRTEEYVIGTLFDMGGSSKVNVHLRLQNGNQIRLATSEQYLRNQEQNFLYRKVQVRVRSEKNVRTGISKNQELISILGEAPSYDETELKTAIKKGTTVWARVPDVGAWVREHRRGGNG